MQLMQIIGDRHVRLIPDVLVGSNGNGNGLVDGLLSMILWNQTGNLPQNGKQVSPTQPSTPTEIVTPSNQRSPDGNSPVVVDFPLDNNIS